MVRSIIYATMVWALIVFGAVTGARAEPREEVIEMADGFTVSFQISDEKMSLDRVNKEQMQSAQNNMLCKNVEIIEMSDGFTVKFPPSDSLLGVNDKAIIDC